MSDCMNNWVWPKYRKRPLVVEAIQVTEKLIMDLAEEKVEIKGLSLAGLNWHSQQREIYSLTLYCKTPEGTMYADLGDWLIRGVKGELYPCKPDIFEMTYEAV